MLCFLETLVLRFALFSYYRRNAEIVKDSIPLLLSKQSLKKCQAVTHMITDKVAIFGNKIDLHLSTSGHYCVDIIPNFTSNEPSQEVLRNIRKYT